MRGFQIYTRGANLLGALRPSHAPNGKIFIPEKSTWPYLKCLKVQLSSSNNFSDMRGPKLRAGAAALPHTPPSGKIHFGKVEFSLSKGV